MDLAMQEEGLESGEQSPDDSQYNQKKKFRRVSLGGRLSSSWDDARLSVPDFTQVEKTGDREIRWDDSRVCEFYLVGFCPEDSLANAGADSDLSDHGCPFIHDDSLKESFLQSPRRESYAPKFEAGLGLFCSLLVAKPGMGCQSAKKNLTTDVSADKSHFPCKEHDRFERILEFLKDYKERRRKMGGGEDMLPDAERRKIDEFRKAILEKRNPPPIQVENGLWENLLWGGEVDIRGLDDLDIQELLREDAETKEIGSRNAELEEEAAELKKKVARLNKEAAESRKEAIKVAKHSAELDMEVIALKEETAALAKERATLMELLKKCQSSGSPVATTTKKEEQ